MERPEQLSTGIFFPSVFYNEDKDHFMIGEVVSTSPSYAVSAPSVLEMATAMAKKKKAKKR